MKFLLNMNLSRDVGKILSANRHTCRHVADIGMARASDAAIVDEARANPEVILTHDLDYGHLLAFSGERSPSVVIFRVRNIQPTSLVNQLVEAWTEIESALESGAIVTIEDSAWRIRALPITQEEIS